MTPLSHSFEDLSQRLTSSIGKLSKSSTPKGVHHLRTVIRRIESLVAYSSPDLRRKQLKTLEHLEALRKRAGKVRDLDVQLELLGGVANGSTADDRRIVTEVLKRKRHKQEKRLASTINKLDDAKFLAQVQKLASNAATEVWAAARPRPLDEGRRRLFSLSAKFPNVRSLPSRELHEIRVKLKMIRYTAELGEDTPEQQQFLEQLKSVQDALGAWHDWQELSKTVKKQFRDRLSCPLLVEVLTLYASRQFAARTAVSRLFASQTAAPQRKPAQSVSIARGLARRAS